jgi:hypothetical protein
MEISTDEEDVARITPFDSKVYGKVPPGLRLARCFGLASITRKGGRLASVTRMEVVLDGVILVEDAGFSSRLPGLAFLPARDGNLHV